MNSLLPNRVIVSTVFEWAGGIDLTIPWTGMNVSDQRETVVYSWTDSYQLRVVVGFHPTTRKLNRFYIIGSGETPGDSSIAVWQSAGFTWLYSDLYRDGPFYNLNSATFTLRNQDNEIMFEGEVPNTGFVSTKQVLFRQMDKLLLYVS